jgi:hypothetical protein
MAITGFDRNINQGTAVCDHCGKRTWKSNIDHGYCDRCNAIFGADITLTDNKPDSPEALQAIKAIKQALNAQDYPPFPDDGQWNSEESAKIVAEHVAARKVA